MRPVRGVAAVLILLVAMGCGVRPTGVISAGEPAVAQQAVPPTTIYMVRQNRLVPLRVVSVFQSGTLVIYYRDATPASRLTIAQLVCSGAAQPGVQRVRLVRNGAQIGPPDCSAFSDLTTQ